MGRHYKPSKISHLYYADQFLEPSFEGRRVSLRAYLRDEPTTLSLMRLEIRKRDFRVIAGKVYEWFETQQLSKSAAPMSDAEMEATIEGAYPGIGFRIADGPPDEEEYRRAEAHGLAFRIIYGSLPLWPIDV